MRKATCRECDSEFDLPTGRGRRPLYCSDNCRKASRKEHDTTGRVQRGYRKRLTCATCAVSIYKGPNSRPQGEAQCTPCRKAMHGPWQVKDPRTPCADCGQPSKGERCKPCFIAATRARATGRDLDARNALTARRARRIRDSGGLTRHGMSKLRAKWLKQGRRCTYCPALATTIDHVVPVALGGTSHEGNLTPACRTCNARKNDSLLAEWKRKMRSDPGVGRARAA